MNKKIISICLIFAVVSLMLTGCSINSSEVNMTTPEGEPVKLTFSATFYDNYGNAWLTATGNSFNIKPNKVKEYSYSSDGYWIDSWTLSSVVSVDVDGRSIESCGSTIIFADSRLEQLDIDIPDNIDTSTPGSNNSITSPGRWSDYWTLQWLWDTQSMQNKDHGAKMVVIQSQNGDPICMFVGDNVTWSVCKNLPKTTQLMIDGKEVYIHRANFAIIDSSFFE